MSTQTEQTPSTGLRYFAATERSFVGEEAMSMLVNVVPIVGMAGLYWRSLLLCWIGTLAVPVIFAQLSSTRAVSFSTLFFAFFTNAMTLVLMYTNPTLRPAEMRVL